MAYRALRVCSPWRVWRQTGMPQGIYLDHEEQAKRGKKRHAASRHSSRGTGRQCARLVRRRRDVRILVPRRRAGYGSASTAFGAAAGGGPPAWCWVRDFDFFRYFGDPSGRRPVQAGCHPRQRRMLMLALPYPALRRGTRMRTSRRRRTSLAHCRPVPSKSVATPACRIFLPRLACSS